MITEENRSWGQFLENGIIVVDKPANISSAKTVAIIKRVLRAPKIGHAGTLDPFATGVLVCCLNKATKLARFFLNGQKKYNAVLHLGEETNTQDSTGTVIARCNRIEFPEQRIRSVFKKFEGTTEQTPPAFSALKHKGVPLYKHARRGKPIQKPPRRVNITSIKILSINIPLVDFEVTCSAGTYIRTLCSDIGRSLGSGGHLKALRRIESSGFSLDEALTLAKLEELAKTPHMSQRITSMADSLRGMPVAVADENLTKKIRQGHPLRKEHLTPLAVSSPKEFIKIINTDNELLAVIKQTKESDSLLYCCVFPR
jgi:tRNA pseudouridine55 synthase